MTENDLTRVMEIEQESFSTPWSLNSFQRELQDDMYSIYLKASHNQNLVGYIGGWLIMEELHITNLAVDCRYRRRGIASLLLAELLKRAGKQGIDYAILEVRKSNRAALELYRSFDFKEVGQRKNYYQNDREDALIMRKELECEL